MCVITPTIGRPTLERALLSAELAPGDEWLVVGDGEQQAAAGLVADLWQRGRSWLRYITGPETRQHGNAQRDYGMRRAAADYFLFLDDDDVFTPGAIEVIRRELSGGPTLFKMRHPEAGVIWRDTVMSVGNVGGAMLALPNNKQRLTHWADHQGHKSDFDFIQDALARWGNRARWCDHVIIEVSPQ